MNFTGNQRKMYLLALALLIVAIALACTWSLWRKPSSAPSGEASPEPTVGRTGAAESSATPAPQAESAVSDAAASEAAEPVTASTIVYYQDNDGYLVPVMCTLPMEDGIAKATLNRMVKSSENDMAAARLGLRTVLPEGTTIDLDIAGGKARIDLSEEALNLSDAAAEANMVSAIVQALTEFDTVEEVEFLIGGQKLESLPHGTDISGTFTRGDINLESSEDAAGAEAASAVTLYFPSEAGSVVVPVTRMVYSQPDINTAVLELAKGPSAAGSLENTLPAGCGLIDVTVEDGTAKLNFTKEFADIALNSDGGRMALKALVLTCTQFDGVSAVEILVEGEPFDPGAGTLNVPTFANVADTIVYDYIQAQAAMILDE